MTKRMCAALAGLLAVGSAAAQAQESAVHRFTVTPLIGTMRWDNASALANKKANDAGAFTENVYTPTFGLSANYNLLRQLGVGFFFEAARPTTRGDYFPALLLRFGQNAELRTVSQRVTVMTYGVQGRATMDLGPASPFLVAGIGAVTVNGDPQQMNDNASFTNTAGTIGGGLAWKLGRGAVTLDVRDYMFFDWDRDELNAVGTEYQNTIIPSANANPPAEKSVVHNIRLAIGYSFVPRGFSSTPDDEQE